jgi:hypothetical protein
MFPKAKITAVSSTGEVKTTAEVPVNQVQASLGGGGTFGTSNVSTQFFAASQYNYYLSGLLPATPDIPDSTALQYFYRDIYLHDNTAGSAVDIQSVFPFSDWELLGLEDHEKDVFDSALARLNLQELMPQLSTAYLTDGFYCGSLIYDAASKNFMDILTHDALQCGVSPSPLNNVDPTIRVSVSGPTLRFLDSATDYAKAYIKTMPKAFVSLLREGSFILDPVTTLWLGRRGLTDRAYQSYLHRILPMYMIEKTMFRGTLVEAQRRQRAMSHITAGDDIWTPTGQELQALVQQFMDAEKDPLGGWLSTRNAVQVQDLRPGGDFWKWTDMTDIMVAYKLRALGISEALLSGDASYAAAESAYSTFLETTNAYRTHLTNAIFYKKLFPLIAISNEMFKDSAKRKKTDSLVDFMFNASNRQNLKMPVLHWHKDLTAKSEDNMMDMLEKVESHGVPVPLKMWLAAAGVDKDTLIRDARENDEIKKELAKYMELPENVANQGGDGSGDGAGDANDEFSDGASDSGSGDSGLAPTQGQKADAAQLTSGSIKAGLGGFAKGILSREFSHEEFTHTITGKKKHIPSIANPRGKATDMNARIAKIAAKVERDPHYKARLLAANKRLGIERLRGVPGGM